MNSTRMLLPTAALLIALGGLGACTQPRLAIDFQPCAVANVDRVVECATVSVPLDYAQPAGEQLSLFVVRAAATGVPKDQPPLMILAGGPGQAAASGYGALVTSAFRQANVSRDIILIDQRGTGESSPLACPDAMAPSYQRIDEDGLAQAVADCLATYEVSPRHFGSEAIVRDVDRVRAFLGEDQVAVWGASFGTRLALRYLARFPDRVSAMVIDGVTSNTESLFARAPEHAQRAFEALLDRCDQSGRCDSATVSRQFASLANAAPTRIRLTDPLSGAVTFREIDGILDASVVRGALYSPSRSALVPLALAQAEQGNHQLLAALAADTAAWAGDTMFAGSTLSILCTEDVDRISRKAAERAGAGSVFGHTYYKFWSAACRHWPRTELPIDYGDAVTSDVPTLALSGGLDPVTPAAAAEVAIGGLGRVQHLVAPNVGHNVTPVGCAPRLIAEFLDVPTAPLDGACLEEPSAPAIVQAGELVL